MGFTTAVCREIACNVTVRCCPVLPCGFVDGNLKWGGGCTNEDSRHGLYRIWRHLVTSIFFTCIYGITIKKYHPCSSDSTAESCSMWEIDRSRERRSIYGGQTCPCQLQRSGAQHKDRPCTDRHTVPYNIPGSWCPGYPGLLSISGSRHFQVHSNSEVLTSANLLKTFSTWSTVLHHRYQLNVVGAFVSDATLFSCFLLRNVRHVSLFVVWKTIRIAEPKST